MKGDRAECFDRMIGFAEHSMWKHGTPGLVLGVTDRNGSIFTHAMGLSDSRCGKPMSPDLLFQIGSVSKSFTCIALLQLAEEGVIDLDEPLTRYLPWFEIKTRFKDITLHHLMTHTAGIIMGSDATPTGWTEVWDLRDTETGCEPGTFFHYSNSGYKALGLVLEAITHKTYEEIIQERVLDLVGMDSTEPVMTNAIRGRLAVAHQSVHDDRPFSRRHEQYPAPWFEGDTADGTICSPVEDMLAYIRALMNGGRAARGEILTPDSFRRMTTPYIQPEDGIHNGGYGYGLNIETVDGHACLGHQGGMVGYYTSMLMDMDLGIGAMVMVNGPGEPDEVARFAIAALRCGQEGGSLPEIPSEHDVFAVPTAPDYVGVYHDAGGTLEVAEDGGGLRVRGPKASTRLERRDGDSFLADGHGLELFLVEFEKRDGTFDRLHHGGRTYVRDGAPANDGPGHGREGPVCEGHYRSHNPWLSNFRVVRRSTGMFFVDASGKSEPLTPLGDDAFRIGKEERSPERVRFDCLIDGTAMSATLAGGGRFGRTFTL